MSNIVTYVTHLFFVFIYFPFLLFFYFFASYSFFLSSSIPKDTLFSTPDLPLHCSYSSSFLSLLLVDQNDEDPLSHTEEFKVNKSKSADSSFESDVVMRTPPRSFSISPQYQSNENGHMMSPDSSCNINQPSVSQPSARRPVFKGRSGPQDAMSPQRLSEQTDIVENKKGEILLSRVSDTGDAVESSLSRRAGESIEGDNTLKTTRVNKSSLERDKNSRLPRRPGGLPASLGQRAISELLSDFEEDWESNDSRRRNTNPDVSLRSVEQMYKMEHNKNNMNDYLIDKRKDNINYDIDDSRDYEENIDCVESSGIDNLSGVEINANGGIAQKRGSSASEGLQLAPALERSVLSKTNEYDGSFADRIAQDLEFSSIESLRCLMGSVLVTVYEQKREINKLNKKIDSLCSLLKDGMKN